jgi:HSP20 family molecular chaperone IbpA
MFLTANTSPWALQAISQADALQRHKAFAQVDRLVREWSRPVAEQSARIKHNTLQQDDKAFTLSLDLPGVAKEHLRIQIEDTVLRVETLEGAPRSYRAVYEFAQEIDGASSQARMEHGVLQLSLTKKLPVNKAIELSIS